MPEEPKLYPGPYTIEFTFLATIGTVALEHKLELNCEVLGDPVPGTDGLEIDVSRRGGGVQTFNKAVADFWTQYRIGLPATVAGASATLWKYTPMSYTRLFIASYGTALGAGTGPGGSVAGHQTQITLRSALGSYLRVNWMEDANANLNQIPLVPSLIGNAQQRVASYLLSVDGWAIARDGSWPVAPLRISHTQNEAIDRKRHRPNS